MIKFIIFLFILAIAWIYIRGFISDDRKYVGGGVRIDRAKSSKHVVVDTLNLTHWMSGDIQKNDIIDMIDKTASCLRKSFSGQVMYVVKDRDSVFNDPNIRKIYQEAARRNKVYIYVTERYVDPPRPLNKQTTHSQLGRDDFYMGLLAWKHRCGVLTQDRMHDFEEMKGTLNSFHVYEYSYWRDNPIRNQINPTASAFSRIHRPIRLEYADYL